MNSLMQTLVHTCTRYVVYVQWQGNTRYHCIRKCNFSTNSSIRGKGWGAIQVNIKVTTSLHLDKTEIIILFETFFFFLIGNNLFFLNKKAKFNYNAIIRSCMIINKHVLSTIINKQALPIIASIHHQFQTIGKRMLYAIKNSETRL